MWRRAGGSGEGNVLNIDAIAGLVISVLLLGYLVYAMLRPEKF